MEPKPDPKPNASTHPADAAKHVAGAHSLLKQLRARLEKLEQHPELEEAIREVETALNILTIKTAGML